MHLLAALSVLWQDYAIKEVRTAVVVNLHTIDGVWSIRVIKHEYTVSHNCTIYQEDNNKVQHLS